LGQVLNIYNFWPYIRPNVFSLRRRRDVHQSLHHFGGDHLTFWENFQKFYMRLIVVETMNHTSYIVID
jgi:hypothetical protein